MELREGGKRKENNRAQYIKHNISEGRAYKDMY
jgi:hypothetical protein